MEWASLSHFGSQHMSKEELQSLDSMELKEKIKFQEPTSAFTNGDVDFYVNVDDDVHVHTALK